MVTPSGQGRGGGLVVSGTSVQRGGGRCQRCGRQSGTLWQFVFAGDADGKRCDPINCCADCLDQLEEVSEKIKAQRRARGGAPTDRQGRKQRRKGDRKE